MTSLNHWFSSQRMPKSGHTRWRRTGTLTVAIVCCINVVRLRRHSLGSEVDVDCSYRYGAANHCRGDGNDHDTGVN